MHSGTMGSDFLIRSLPTNASRVNNKLHVQERLFTSSSCHVRGIRRQGKRRFPQQRRTIYSTNQDCYSSHCGTVHRKIYRKRADRTRMLTVLLSYCLVARAKTEFLASRSWKSASALISLEQSQLVGGQMDRPNQPRRRALEYFLACRFELHVKMSCMSRVMLLFRGDALYIKSTLCHGQ